MHHLEQQQHPEQMERSPTQGEAASPTTLLVGSRDGAAALLRARTGALVWRASTRRELGTLAHDGVQAYVAFGSSLRLIRPRVRGRESPERRWRRFARLQARLQAEPARLEARRAHDGALLWRRADWGLIGRLDVGAAAQSDVVVVGSTSSYGDHALYGLDVRTGATRWTYLTNSQRQVNGRRFAVHGGRIYCYGGGETRGLTVLDARSGEPLWSRDALPELVFSPHSQVVLEQCWRQGEQPLVRLLDAATGTVRQELALDGLVRAVSDTGVAYLSSSHDFHSGLAAVRLDDGRELWRVEGIRVDHLAVTDTTLYCALLLERRGIGAVVALAAGSGQRRWRWHTPGDLRALLRLWGARTPGIAASATLLVGKALADALTQPSLRAIGAALWREVAHGQWRHPYELHGAVNAMWLAADTGAAYLGTRLGVFALGADDGRLRWHALPITDVSFVDPALPPD